MTITRLTNTRFAVVVDVVMSDGSLRADHWMRLDGNVLRSVEQRGCIRIGGLMRVVLSDKVLDIVNNLKIGETLIKDNNR